MGDHQGDQSQSVPGADWLVGGGEMGDLIRSMDWSKTPLGPIASWPHSLKTAINIMLNSRYPMFVWWGDELIDLYNSAYSLVLGKRHPEALGVSAREVWADIWDVVGPQAEGVLREGRATWNDEVLLVMERNDFAEETYFTWSYSPLPNDNGKVNGVFCACTEETIKVVGKRRLKTLRDLGARTFEELKTAEDACRAAAKTLGENPYDISFALIYLLDEDGEQAKLCGTVGLEAGSGPATEYVQIKTESDRWNLNDALATKKTQVIDNLTDRFGRLTAGRWTDDFTRQAVVVPLAKSGVQEFPAGFLIAGISPRLRFDDDYRGFFDLVAGHISTTIANGRAYAEECKRAEALAELDRAKTAFFSNVSHEFRTPLTLMLGPVEEALADPATPSAIKERLEVGHRNSLRLLKLVNSLLDFSRIEAGRIQASYEPTDLASLTAELASVFRAAIEGAGMKLIVDCKPLSEPVHIDHEMWEKIVLNLISNAFKYTLTGEIEVSLRESGEWRVESDEKGEAPDGRPELSRAQSVAGGDGLGGSVLSRDKDVSEGGTVRPSQGRGIGSSKHRGGTGEKFHEGVPQSSQHRARVAAGVGDPPAAQSAGGSAHPRAAESPNENGGGGQSNAFGTSSRTGEKSGELSGERDSSLATHHSQQTTRSVVLTVRDTGIGIAEYELPHIFERFYRVEGARGRTHEGSGIGLALVQELVKLHGGTISVESAHAQGSTFTVRLPLGRAHLPPDRIGAARTLSSTGISGNAYVEEALRWLPAETKDEEDEWLPTATTVDTLSRSTTRGSRVIIADDNADMRDYIRRLLIPHYRVESVADGGAALAAARREKPDLMVIDVMMPGIDGFALLRAIREDESLRTIPVIMLSARAGEESRVEGLEAGADDYLFKPFSARELLACVGAQLAISQVRAEALQREAQREIAQRKEADEALRESETRFRTLSDYAPVLIWLNSPTGCEFVNESYLGFLGVTMADVHGMGWTKYIHVDDYEKYVGEYLAASEKRAMFEGELRFRRADGVYRRMKTVGVPRFSPTGDYLGYIGSTYDIEDAKQAQEEIVRLNLDLENTVAERTRELLQANRALLRDMEERKKLEEQLLQAQKMESIGTLAGGIAHDFNNILNIIQGYAFILRGQGLQNKQTSESLTVISETVQRGSALVQQLLTLARKTAVTFEPVNANAVVEGLMPLMAQTFPKTIDFGVDLEPDLPPMMADANQISQALLNLCVNARDAMPGGGRLTLRTQAVDGVSLPREFCEADATSYVCIEIADTGTGIDASIQKHIFDPFFTTKEAGLGTGLGLSVVYGIATNHNGFIDVQSKAMCGTTFRLYLPAAPARERPATAATTEDGLKTVDSRGSGRILVVEDESSMVLLLRKVLLRQGYHVVEATDGQTALDVYKREKDNIDAVLLDIGLPKKGGEELLLQMREHNPDVKVIVASGYIEPELKADMKRIGIEHFIDKPYMPDQIIQALQSLLRDHDARS